MKPSTNKPDLLIHYSASFSFSHSTQRYSTWMSLSRAWAMWLTSVMCTLFHSPRQKVGSECFVWDFFLFAYFFLFVFLNADRFMLEKASQWKKNPILKVGDPVLCLVLSSLKIYFNLRPLTALLSTATCQMRLPGALSFLTTLVNKYI